MSGFQSPNYTQTPNDLFDELLPDMGLAELKVIMCVVRHTFGYHRDEVKLSIRTIARFTGLTVNSVMEGARQAESHGLIERYIDGNKTTLWRAVVSVVPTKTRRLSRRDADVSPTETQFPLKDIKDSIKERERPLDFESMSIEQAKKVPTLRMYWRATEFWPGSLLWEYIHNTITQHSLLAETIRAAAIEWQSRGYRQENIKGILEWAINGIPPGKNGQVSASSPAPAINTNAVENTKRTIEDKWNFTPAPPPSTRPAIKQLAERKSIR